MNLIEGSVQEKFQSAARYMNVRVLVAIVVAGMHLAAIGSVQGQVSTLPASMPSSRQAVINRYCVTCHNEKLKTAGLLLNSLNVEDPAARGDVWEKVVRKLRAGQMPPSGLPRPSQSEIDSLIEHLETSLDRTAAANPNPGRSAAHRLNRTEYENAVRDLLALEIDGASLLPADDSGGFDNFGDLLSVSPLLMEKYLAAARKISRLAVGNPAITPDSETYEVSPLLTQTERMSEDLPFGSRGGMVIRHHFPLDGEYVVKVRLQRVGQRSYTVGIAEPHILDLRIDGERLKLFKEIGRAHV